MLTVLLVIIAYLFMSYTESREQRDREWDEDELTYETEMECSPEFHSYRAKLLAASKKKQE